MEYDGKNSVLGFINFYFKLNKLMVKMSRDKLY